MVDNTVYVIDFEGSLSSGIVEYGLVGVVLNQGIFEAHTRLCYVHVPIASSEQQCHGLSEQDLKGTLPFSNDLNRFIQARQKGIFCAHNAVFENQLLSRYCPVVNFSKKSYECDTHNMGWGPWLDTYGLYKRLFTQAKDCTLQCLITTLQLEHDLRTLAVKYCPPKRRRYHCALYDALACALLLMHYVRMPFNQGKDLNALLIQSSLGIKSSNERNQMLLL